MSQYQRWLTVQKPISVEGKPVGLSRYMNTFQTKLITETKTTNQTTLRNGPRVDGFNTNLQHHQSVSQACTPRGEPFQGAGAKFSFYTNVAFSLAAKIYETIQMLLPHFIVVRSVLPLTQSLVTPIHLQFAVPTVFWPPKPPLPHRFNIIKAC